MLPAGTILFNRPYYQSAGCGDLATAANGHYALQAGLAPAAAMPSASQVPQQVMYIYNPTGSGVPSGGLPLGMTDPSSAYSFLPASVPSYQQYQQQLQQPTRTILPCQYQQVPQMLNGHPQTMGASAATAFQVGLQQFPQLQQAAMAYLPADQVFMTAGKKRGSEEMLSLHATSLSNPNVAVSDAYADLTIEAKKPKLDSQPQQQQPTATPGNTAATAKPSRVLHFRGVPNDATESEIIQLGIPFGSVTNLVLAKKKNQALLEMADLSFAQAAVNFYSQRSPLIRGHPIQVQFSNYEQLITESTSAQNGGDAQVMQLAGSVLESAAAAEITDEARTVLRVIVENVLYPVTVDNLKQMFSRFGDVLKIVTFSKNNSYQALLQFADAGMAHAAKLGLNGQTMYTGCNNLRVDFSKMNELNVKFNNDKSFDYTNPMLPSGEGAPSPADQQQQQQQQLQQMQQQQQQQQQVAFVSAMNASISKANGLQSGQTIKYIPGIGPAMVTYTHGGIGVPNGAYSVGNSPALQLIHPSMLAASQNALSAATGGILLASAQLASVGSVLLVSNLNETKVTPDALFTLFGVYGDVNRVKIMFNKQDTALIQFADALQAQTAMLNLDKLKLWGKMIKVTPSKHTVVQMPKEGQPDAGLTKDFPNSPLHRFKKPNSKNYHNIFPPSATLHLSNIPSTSKEKLIELFSEHGNVVGFKFFHKDCKMALLQMNSIEEAANGLIAMHNYQLAETCHLRVSFSKSSVNPPAATDVNNGVDHVTYDVINGV